MFLPLVSVVYSRRPNLAPPIALNSIALSRAVLYMRLSYRIRVSQLNISAKLRAQARGKIAQHLTSQNQYNSNPRRDPCSCLASNESGRGHKDKEHAVSQNLNNAVAVIRH